jgi:hypothetical protein
MVNIPQKNIEIFHPLPLKIGLVLGKDFIFDPFTPQGLRNLRKNKTVLYERK